MRRTIWPRVTAFLLPMLALAPAAALAQQNDRTSVGRGWPVPVAQAAPVSGGMEGEGQQASWNSPPP